ncbi:MAG: TIGR00730 family Rossman fold protein [Pseudomonadales bacterium]
MRYAIYCGSSFGAHRRYRDATQALGEAICARHGAVVYGGAQVGLMGAIADTVLAGGGHVTGVMPKALTDKELQHEGLSELFVVEDMHQRKAKMAELADAFIAMPGGMGTLEEISEVLTWAQLGFHRKACALYNVAGFYDPLIAFLERAVAEGFMSAHYRDKLIVSDDPEQLLMAIEAFEPPPSKWQ